MLSTARQGGGFACCILLTMVLATTGESAESTVRSAAAGKTSIGATQVRARAAPAKVEPEAKKGAGQAMTMAVFLDRLMVAESGGRDRARNPRSSALGPYQFIKSTFLEVMRKHFAEDVAKLSPAQVLALRTNREFSRKAAEAYTRDNAALLAAAEQKPTFPHLRLAYLLGAGGAVKVLSAPAKTRLSALLSRRVIRANPFMARLTAAGLIRRAARDISTDPRTTAGVVPGKFGGAGRKAPRIKVRCSLARASCRRWLALAKRRLRRKLARAGKQ